MTIMKRFPFRLVKPREDADWNWIGMQEMIENFTLVEQLIVWVEEVGPTLPPIQLNITNVRLDTDRPDAHMLRQVPADCPVRNPIPLYTTGDGACFARSMVRLLWGVPSFGPTTKCFQAELKVCLLFLGNALD